jgi:hypothetical protein
VQIKRQSRLTGDLMSEKLDLKKCCYPFVIRFSGFTRLFGSTYADYGEHFA